MKKCKRLLAAVTSVVVLFSFAACGGGGITEELDLTVAATGIEVSGEDLWKAAFDATKDSIQADGCTIEAQGVYNVSMMKTENTCEMTVLGTENGVTKANLLMRESFPFKPTNEKIGQLLVEDGQPSKLTVGGATTQGDSAIGEFYKGEYSVGYLTYQVSVALMHKAAREAYSYCAYDAETTAYTLNEDTLPPSALDKLNEHGIELDELDFKIWIGEGKVLAMTYELKASSGQLVAGVEISGNIKGKFVLNQAN